MKLSRAAILWSVVFILGCVHIQARSQTRDEEETHQMLRKSQGAKNPSQSTIYSRQQNDDTGYVTEEKFTKTVNIMQEEISSMMTQLDEHEGKMGDHCGDDPCENEGDCRNRLGGYDCLCKPGYGGANCEHSDGRSVSAMLTVDNGGPEGYWAVANMCPPGSFARTFQIKLEDDQVTGDDSCMNNIQFYCRDPVTGTDVKTIKAGNGPYGTWRDWQDCPSGEFLTGFSMKVEIDQVGEDDSAANGVTMTCSGGTEITGPIGVEGVFGTTALCPEGHAICGVNVKIEPYQGHDIDDSGLNDIMMMCCAWW